jgi:hypothetical protein
MKVQVFVLRRSGRRFQDRNQEGIAGELSLHSLSRGSETHRIAQLCSGAGTSAHEKHLLPPMYSPDLIAIGGNAFLLRGYEAEGGVGYVQEWRCVIA